MRLRLRPEARLDLEAAARWYEAQEQGLGRLFLEEVRATFHRIRTNPEVYALGYRGTRRDLIQRFPYGVIYLPVPAQNRVVVLAVLHCGRDPKLWLQRSKP
ncbi:MAG: type II toxin-antitoxin system RelE/ParE family toxin [Prochlorococcaceae cyanobacterium]